MEKYAYFCSRFQKEIVEALYLRLAIGNLRNFQVTQVSMTVSRVLAWGCFLFLRHKVILRTSN